MALSVILDIFVDKVSLDDCKKFLILFWVGILIEKISAKKEGTPITNVIEAPTSERWSTDTTLKMSGTLSRSLVHFLIRSLYSGKKKLLQTTLLNYLLVFYR